MKKYLSWIPTMVWMFMIFGVSSQSTLHASSVYWLDFIIKKSAHFIEYFILNLLINYSLKSSFSLSKKRQIATAIGLAIIYAATDEFHQTFVAGRDGRLRDVLIDSAGILLSAKFLTFFPAGLR